MPNNLSSKQNACNNVNRLTTNLLKKLLANYEHTHNVAYSYFNISRLDLSQSVIYLLENYNKAKITLT